MTSTQTRLTLSAVGASALIVTGADHLDEYAANNFSTVPTIGPLFLLNFIAATAVGTGLLMALGVRRDGRLASLRPLLVLSGIAIAASSLIALWISESSSLFGFTDYGFRPTIIVAIGAESVAVLTLSAYLALDRRSLLGPLRRLAGAAQCSPP